MSAIEKESTDNLPIEATMTAILATMTAILYGLHSIQIPLKSKRTSTFSSSLQLSSALPIQLPNPQTEPTKYCYEIFCTKYTIFWISSFSYIVISQCYEYFTAWTYLFVCGGLALPLVIQPWLYPSAGFGRNSDFIVNPDVHRPLSQRYSTKCTIYLLTYSFIGNHWYTHYFYSVLQAKYTMPAHRLNDVPIAMYLATHFYFTTYHACVGNGFLRFVDRNYGDRDHDERLNDGNTSNDRGNDTSNNLNGNKKRGWRKQILFWYTVLYLSYFTAFMETLTISSFPYYSFQDRVMAYKYGSAFYGIYFLVSFPGFYYLDRFVDEDLGVTGKSENEKQHQLSRSRAMSLMDTFVTSCGHGMMILTLLDFVRLYLGIPLKIGGVAFAATGTK